MKRNLFQMGIPALSHCYLTPRCLSLLKVRLFISLNFMELGSLWKSCFTFSVYHSRANVLEWLLCGQQGRKCIFLVEMECGNGSFGNNEQITGAQQAAAPAWKHLVLALFKILWICDLLSRKGLFSGAFGISCRYTSCVWSWEEPDSSTSSTPGDAGLHLGFFGGGLVWFGFSFVS